MKKLARLQMVERIHGPEFVSPYRACYDIRDMLEAFRWAHRIGENGLCIRTDYADGQEQGFGLPFIYPAAPADAWRLWDQYGRKLMYILNRQVQPVLTQGVALRLDGEHVFFEVNSFEPMSAQRGASKNTKNLRQFIVGHGGYHPAPWGLFRSYNPEDVAAFSLDVIWRESLRTGVEEITFSVRAADKSVVIW